VLLVEKGAERRRRETDEETDRMTIAMANGYVISRDEKARDHWVSARERRSGAAAEVQTVAEYQATKARLAARFPANVQVH
jgi:frataxin-like iron-binding protein CyaY